jgi:aminoglycoside 6'-N-acetyltransferase I
MKKGLVINCSPVKNGATAEIVKIISEELSSRYTGTEYIINELCIKTDRQGGGAGTFFLTQIEETIKEMGLKQIFLLTDRDVPAYNFYKKNNYVEVSNLVPFAKHI